MEKGPQLGPGGGILVDPSTVGRPIGDTSSSAVFVSDLPKNYSGGTVLGATEDLQGKRSK